MLIIFQKEIQTFLNSLSAYIVIVLFLIANGLFMWYFPSTNLLDYGYADMESLFTLAPYIFMFMIPAITMRSFAEEKKSGTMELLMTQPLSNWEIVLGKYLAAWFVVCLTLLPTLIYYVSIYTLGNPRGNIDTAATIGSYIGLILLAGVFASIGIFASSLTENQIIAFIISLFMCFILNDGFTLLANTNDISDFSYIISQLGINYHYEFIRRGLIDSRNVIYFLSIIVIMLFITNFLISNKK